MPPNQPFQLLIRGGDDPRRYTVQVLGEDSQPLAENNFEWRVDSTALALDLAALARAAVGVKLPEDEAHLRL